MKKKGEGTKMSEKKRGTIAIVCLLLLALCLLGACAAPASVATPTPTPSPTPTPEGPKELWGFPIDDTHDAFEVPTGGKLGTVLVTVEAEGEDEMDGLYDCTFAVWNVNDLTRPIQTFEPSERMGVIHWPDLMDANFDGYMDFCYTLYSGATNDTFCLCCWDEAQGQFVLAGEAFGYGFEVDEENKVLKNYVHYTMYSSAGETYRWEDGELVCFRREEYNGPMADDELQRLETVTYELVDGEMVEVSRETHAMQGL